MGVVIWRDAQVSRSTQLGSLAPARVYRFVRCSSSRWQALLMLVPVEESDNELSVSRCICICVSLFLSFGFKQGRQEARVCASGVARPPASPHQGSFSGADCGRGAMPLPEGHAHIEKLVRWPRFQLSTQQTERAEEERGTGFRVLSRSI